MAAGDPAIIAAEHVVTPDGVLAPGWIRIADGRIEAVRHGEPPAPAARFHTHNPFGDRIEFPQA